MTTARTTTRKPRTSKVASSTETLAATEKVTARKRPAARKPASLRPAQANRASAEERYRMTEVAAYFLAERDGFQGSSIEYWVAAEAQITKLLEQ